MDCANTHSMFLPSSFNFLKFSYTLWSLSSQCWVESEIEAQHIILQTSHSPSFEQGKWVVPSWPHCLTISLHPLSNQSPPAEGGRLEREMADTVLQSQCRVSHIQALKVSQDRLGIVNSLIPRPQSNLSQLAVCLNSVTV